MLWSDFVAVFIACVGTPDFSAVRISARSWPLFELASHSFLAAVYVVLLGSEPVCMMDSQIGACSRSCQHSDGGSMWLFLHTGEGRSGTALPALPNM